MKYIKLMAFAALVFSTGLAFAADKTVKITKISGTVQIMKDGVVVMTIKPGDAIPTNLGANVSFNVVSGSIEVEAGGMKINGVTGSQFKPTFTNGSMVVASQGTGSVEVKSASGNSVVLPTGSVVKMTDNGKTVDIEVQKGSAVVSDASGGATQVVKEGDKASIPSAPVAVAPAQTQAPKEEPKEEAVTEEASNPADTTVYIPETSVSVTQEATQAAEVSGSTP